MVLRWMSVPFHGWSSVSGYAFQDSLLAEAACTAASSPTRSNSQNGVVHPLDSIAKGELGEASRSSTLPVLIQTEEIRRIVLLLDGSQQRAILSVSGLNPVASLFICAFSVGQECGKH